MTRKDFSDINREIGYLMAIDDMVDFMDQVRCDAGSVASGSDNPEDKIAASACINTLMLMRSAMLHNKTMRDLIGYLVAVD